METLAGPRDRSIREHRLIKKSPASRRSSHTKAVRVIAAPTLSGHCVTLRAPKPEDTADRLILGQSPEIVRMFGGDPGAIRPLTEAAAKMWVDRLAEHPCAWMVEHEGRMLGEIRLDAVDNHDRRAQLAVGLYDPAKLGMGLGREAIRLALKHAFDNLGLHRIGVRVLAYNIRAIRCYSACGFIEEGREREAALVAGEWHDDIIMGLLSRDFRLA
jgi:[ribosomal protein S5]-alanine N-acetyltransferase